MALLIYRLMEKELGEEYTVTEIINTLRHMYLTKVTKGAYTPSFTRTILTDELHETVPFRLDYEVITPSKLRSIIRSSKSK